MPTVLRRAPSRIPKRLQEPVNMTSKLCSLTLPSFHPLLHVPKKVLAPGDSQMPQSRAGDN